MWKVTGETEAHKVPYKYRQIRSILPRTYFILGRLCGREKVKTEPSFQTNMINSQRFKVNFSSTRTDATLLVNGVGYEDLHTIKTKTNKNATLWTTFVQDKFFPHFLSVTLALMIYAKTCGHTSIRQKPHTRTKAHRFYPYLRSRRIHATLLRRDAGSESLREDLQTHFYSIKTNKQINNKTWKTQRFKLYLRSRWTDATLLVNDVG